MSQQLDYAQQIEYEAMFSTDKKKIIKALFDFQQLVGPIKRTQTASIRTDKGTYDYNFADLTDTVDSIKPLLKKLGLYVDWGSEPSRLNTGGTIITCTVFHVESGEYKSVSLPAFHEGSSQRMCGAISFTRPYPVNVRLGSLA